MTNFPIDYTVENHAPETDSVTIRVASSGTTDLVLGEESVTTKA